MLVNEYKVIECTFEQHGQAILAIFNDAILNTTALYEYEERTLKGIEQWFAHKTLHQFPIVGIENDEGILMGFASYGAFRQFPANRFTVEHSVYVHQAYRGQGLAMKLLCVLIQRAKQQNMRTMIGAIDASNVASIGLHKKLGFNHVGTLSEVGFKFDSWLDLALYQLILNCENSSTI